MSDGPASAPLTRRLFCNNCGNETNHTCEGDHYRDYENNNPDGSLGSVERLGYRLWICAGCERGTLEEYYVFDILDENMLKAPESAYFPERTRLHVKKKDYRRLPPKLDTIYREALQAYNHNLAVLCAVGVRALLEGICSDKQVGGKNLESKIDSLVGILPSNIVSNLHALRFIGNEAAHELDPPTTEDLRLAIEICDDLLNYLYELDYKASQLYSSRQARKANRQ